MSYKLKNTKYTFCKRAGKDCYVWFELRDYWKEAIFKSSVHKISLNVYRMFRIKHYLKYKSICI